MLQMGQTIGETMAGLLNIGEMGALALHVLVELAVLREKDPKARRTVQDIATQLNASTHTLQKVARRLIIMDLIEGTRGANGGLRLIADPSETTIKQVLEGIEGKFQSNGCMFATRVCPSGAQCAFANVTCVLERRIAEYFTNTTMADLCSSASPAPPIVAPVGHEV